MPLSGDKNRVIVAYMIAKMWRDPDFKLAFLKDPKAALAAEGITVPAGVDVSVLEDTFRTKYLVLPKPSAPNYAKLKGTVDRIIADREKGKPAGIEFKVVEDSDGTAHFVIPTLPPGFSAAHSTQDQILEMAAAGSVAVNTTAVANAYVAANAVAVQNAVGATEVGAAAEGVVVAVVAGVLT